MEYLISGSEKLYLRYLKRGRAALKTKWVVHKFVNKKLCFIVKPQAKQCIWTMWVRPWKPLCIVIQIWDESENRVAATLYHVLLGGFYILVWNLGNEEKRERDARLNFSFFLSLPFLPQLVILHRQLLEKTKVGLDLSGQNTISKPSKKEGLKS